MFKRLKEKRKQQALKAEYDSLMGEGGHSPPIKLYSHPNIISFGSELLNSGLREEAVDLWNNVYPTLEPHREYMNYRDPWLPKADDMSRLGDCFSSVGMTDRALDCWVKSCGWQNYYLSLPWGQKDEKLWALRGIESNAKKIGGEGGKPESAEKILRMIPRLEKRVNDGKPIEEKPIGEYKEVQWAVEDKDISSLLILADRTAQAGDKKNSGELMLVAVDVALKSKGFENCGSFDGLALVKWLANTGMPGNAKAILTKINNERKKFDEEHTEIKDLQEIGDLFKELGDDEEAIKIGDEVRQRMDAERRRAEQQRKDEENERLRREEEELNYSDYSDYSEYSDYSDYDDFANE